MRALVACALLLAACSGPDYGSLPDSSFTVVSDAEIVTARVDLATSAPVRGTNRLWLSFTPEEAAVRVTSARAELGEQTSTGNVVPDSDPLAVELGLPSRGEWQVRLELEVNGDADALTFALEVD